MIDEIEDGDGVARRLGCLVPTSFPTHYRAFADAFQAEMMTLAQIRAALALNNGRSMYGRRERFSGQKYIRNQRNYGSCFPPGTLVRMADGSQKPIEKVQLLDEVLTAEGNRRRVLKVMVRPHTGEVLRLKVWGHRHLRATGEHPILTKRGYVSVEHVQKGDWVSMPRYMPATVESIVPAEYVTVTRKAAQRKTYAHAASCVHTGIPGKPAVTIEKTPLPELIRLNAAFGRLVGLFLAEGSVSCGRVTFHFHENERDTLAAEVVRLFREEFGVKANVAMNRGHKRTCEVKVYGTGWASMLEGLCKVGSGNKGLHPHLASGPQEFLEAVLSGWQAGDGLGDADRCGGVTVSHELAMNMYDIASALGHKPTVETLQVKINPRHKIKRRLLRYVVAWPASGADGRWVRAEQDEKTVWRLVDSVEPEPFSGYVYNLEVEGDHSYVAESIGVHNCNGFSTAGALSRMRELRGEPYVCLSGADAYSLMNSGRDDGSILSDGLKLVEANGIAPESLVPWDHIYTHQISAEAKAARARFKGFAVYAVDTEEELATGLLLGDVGVVAVHATNAFMSDDGDGVNRGGNGVGNHSVGVQDVRMLSDGTLAFDMFNSWDVSYCDRGHTWLTFGRHLRETVKYHRFWLLRSTTDDTGDDSAPPPVKE